MSGLEGKKKIGGAAVNKKAQIAREIKKTKL